MLGKGKMKKGKLSKEFSFGMGQAAVKLQQRKTNPWRKLTTATTKKNQSKLRFHYSSVDSKGIQPS